MPFKCSTCVMFDYSTTFPRRKIAPNGLFVLAMLSILYQQRMYPTNLSWQHNVFDVLMCFFFSLMKHFAVIPFLYLFRKPRKR